MLTLVEEKRARRAERWERKASIPERLRGSRLADLTISQSVHDQCMALVDRMKVDGSPKGVGLILWGPPGRGKSTIAVSTLREIFHTVDAKYMNHTWESYPHRPGYYITYPGLIRLEKRAFGNGVEAEDARALLDSLYSDQTQSWLNCKVLVLDDVGKEHSGASGFTKNVLHDLLRSRYDAAAPTIITTNLRPSEWETLYGEATGSFIYEAFDLVKVSGDDRRI